MSNEIHGHHSELAKELGLKETISVAVGAMIGGGIFTVLGFLAGFAGPAAVFSFSIGGLIALLTTHSYIRLVSEFPSSGGEFVIIRKVFKDPRIGNVIGGLLWLGYSVTIALYAFTFGIYTTEFLHSTFHNEIFAVDSNPAFFSFQRAMAAFVILVFMLVNLKGVKETGFIQNVIVAFKLGVLLWFALMGLKYVKGERFSTVENFAPNGVMPVFIGAAVIFVAYEGFQVIANTVEEMKNPNRDVKLGMYISVIVVALTYMAVAYVAIGMSEDPSKLDEAALIESVRSWGAIAVLLITMGAIASTSSAINATLLGSSRLAYTMSDWKAFPEKLAVISKKSKVPYLSIIITSMISWVFTFVGDARSIAEVGSIIFLGIFMMINITAIVNFRGERNIIAYFGVVAIIFYMGAAIWFMMAEGLLLAVIIITVFVTVTILWVIINSIRMARLPEFEPPTIPPPTETALAKREIPMFEYKDTTDVFFLELDKVLVTVSGKKHETQAIQFAGLLARKYKITVDLLNVGKDESSLNYATEVMTKFGVQFNKVIKQGKNISEVIINQQKEENYQLIIMGSRRKKTLLDRLFDTSTTKKVVDGV
ncbi:MAG: amino acid permease, partial [Candidatus Heimdallarchaeota archaeon]|nr:amino acid permease [Candidatus Heimdallarchaeota archaeon]